MSTEAKNQGHPGDARYLRPSPSRGSTRRSEQHHAAGGPTRAQPRGNRTKKRREFGFAWRIFGASRETGTPAGSGGPRKPQRNPRTAKWAQQGLNLRPLPCEGSALPLSYTPEKLAQVAIRQIGSQWPDDGR